VTGYEPKRLLTEATNTSTLRRLSLFTILTRPPSSSIKPNKINNSHRYHVQYRSRPSIHLYSEIPILPTTSVAELPCRLLPQSRQHLWLQRSLPPASSMLDLTFPRSKELASTRLAVKPCPKNSQDMERISASLSMPSRTEQRSATGPRLRSHPNEHTQTTL
jgi:hypothetical protein